MQFDAVDMPGDSQPLSPKTDNNNKASKKLQESDNVDILKLLLAMSKNVFGQRGKQDKSHCKIKELQKWKVIAFPFDRITWDSG